MLDSLYTGTAGIKSNSTALGTVGSNIANVSTVGYKASRSSFAMCLMNPWPSALLARRRYGRRVLWSRRKSPPISPSWGMACSPLPMMQVPSTTPGTGRSVLMMKVPW